MNELFKKYADEILRVFSEVIRENVADSILLSGGLDTSVLACLARKFFKFKTVTVGFAGGNAPDLYYAKLVSEHLNIENQIKIFDVEEAIEAATHVIKTIKSFDPLEVRNDITICIGIKYLAELGVRSVITGDGGDELFAGYSFLFKLKPREVDEWIKGVVGRWSFASEPIGESFGVRVLQPFTDRRIVELALKIPAEFKIVVRHGITYGKYILRKAFEKLLPSEVIWREKHPIELGSGSVELGKIFRVSPEEFRKLSERVSLMSEEQAFYFKIYLENFGEIPKPKPGEKACPRCGGGVPVNRNHCKICGAYPV